MKRFLRGIMDIRQGEWTVTLLMILYYYLILVTQYFLKPARDSMFLTKLGAEQLPWVLMIIAAVVVPITTLYSRASRRLSLSTLMAITTVIMIATLMVCRYLLTIEQGWVFYVFYVWVSIYGILTTSQFWLMANAVYDASQAKRVFVPIGLAGILGAFTGGQVSGLIVTVFGVSTPNLLFFCVGFLVICILISGAVWRLTRVENIEQPRRQKQEPGEKRKESLSQVFKTIKGSRHLSLTVGIVTMTIMVGAFVDFEFKMISSNAISGTDDLTAFLGSVYSLLSVAGLPFQLILSHRFLRKLGVGGVLLFLPFGLLLGTAGMLVWPGLLAGVILKGADGAFKYSIDKTARELLFLPVPLEIKKRTKLFIDMFMDRWSKGMAGAILLGMTTFLPMQANTSLSLRILSIPSLVLIAMWVGFVVMIRKEYVNTFRRALERREINIDEIRVNITDANTVNTLIAGLGSRNERQVVYSLEMLRSVDELELVWPIRPLLQHPSLEVRRKAVRALHRHGDASVVADAEKLLSSSDAEIRRDAMHLLAKFGEESSTAYYRRQLSSDNPGTRCTAVAAIAEYGSREEKELVSVELVGGLLDPQRNPAVEERRMVAGSLGRLGQPNLSCYFDKLLDDDSEDVVKEAITSVGKLQVRQYVPWLINALGKRAYRTVSRDALSAYGTQILGTLCDYMSDCRQEFTIRRNIPRVIAAIPYQRSVDVLTEAVEQVEPRLKFYVVKALNRLHKDYPSLDFNDEAVHAALLGETKIYYEIACTLHLNDWGDRGSGHLLKRALIERQEQNLERIFRLLGLRYPSKDIYTAYQGIISPRKTLRASAIEFLDNVLKADTKRYLLPILDQVSQEELIRKGNELFGIKFADTQAAIRQLLDGRDPWIKACALYFAIEKFPKEFADEIARAAGDPDPVVQETAALAGRAA